jgi:pyroglutamyl-peptidase
MPRVLITAFGPYGKWAENSSWLALVELTRQLPALPEITTRLYPVDLATVTERLTQDLPGHDYVLHLGQAPGATSVQLEAIGINVRAGGVDEAAAPQPLVADGPTAYQSRLPLAAWADKLRRAGIPARVSYHAGTFLCNATLYLTHFFCEKHQWPIGAAFVHLPLTVNQAIGGGQGEHLPSMPSSAAADAIRLILEELTN